MTISNQDLTHLLDRIRRHASPLLAGYRNIVIFGPSGAGKTTIVRGPEKSILQLRPEVYDFSISATTRDRRANERYGVDYFFMTVLMFTMRAFIEDNNYGGNKKLYGTLVSEIERIMLQMRKKAVFDVDINGAKALKEIFGDDIYTVYLNVTRPTLKRRLINRLPVTGESMDDVERRLNTADEERLKVESGFFVPDLILPYEDDMQPGDAAEIIVHGAYQPIAA